MDPTAFTCIIVVQASTSTILLYCYIGSLTTEQFLRFGDISYEFPWYKIPVDLQKYIPLMIADAHRRKKFTGFGIIDLDLAAFLKVIGDKKLREEPLKLELILLSEFFR